MARHTAVARACGRKNHRAWHIARLEVMHATQEDPMDQLQLFPDIGVTV